MDQIRSVQKIEKCYSIEQGCTKPIKVELDDGTKAVLKYPRNPQGLVVLVNEYVAYHIAKRMGITCPVFGVAVVDDAMLDTMRGISAEISVFCGIGFYCEYVSGGVKASLNVLRKVSNLNEVSKIILLDEIIRNSDRHAANALVSITENPARLYMIDHSHAFGTPDWNQETLLLTDAESPYVWSENREFYDMLISAGACVTSKDLEATSQMIAERITDEFLDDVLGKLPEPWVAEIGVTNIGHLKQYILYRVENIAQICRMINEERGV